MSQLHVLLQLGRSVEIAALVLAVLFVAQYTWYSPWWRDPIGRTVVAEAVAVFLSLAPGLFESYFTLTTTEYVVMLWFNFAFIALIPAIFAWRILVWHKLPHGMNLRQRRSAERKKKRGD